MRPWKRMLWAPAPAVKRKLPRVTERVQRRLCLFLEVTATHRLPTLRPGSVWTNANRTAAASFNLKWKVVPIGGFRTFAMWGSALPRRQRRCDSLTPLSEGRAVPAPGAGGAAPGEEGGVPAGF